MVYSLYFEVIALIVEYFQVGYYFLLRHIISIGITAIIIDHPSSQDVPVYEKGGIVMMLWLYDTAILTRELNIRKIVQDPTDD